MNILVIDIGTTSMRGILYNRSGKELCQVSRLTPLIFTNDYIEQDPLTLKDKMTEIIREIADAFTIDAISVTAFRSAPALIDKEGNPLSNFIMWQDTRNKEICERIEPKNREIHQTVGAKVNAVFTASKITWFKEHLTDVYNKAYKALVVPDYLINVMTGAFTSEKTYGSRTGVMNIHSLEYDEEMLRLYNLDLEKLPELKETGSIAGNTTAAFEKATGVKAGTPVITTGGDQQNSALGLGEMDDSSLVINCGTGSFIISLIDHPYLDNQAMICNTSAIPGKYVLESNVLASAAALNWLLKELFPELWNDGEPDFVRFHEIISVSAPGANGVRIVPLFQGCGSRDWNLNARASFSHISLGNTRADLGRAMFEGIAAEIARSVRSLPERCQNVSQIYIGGGLTKSELFDQILSDMLGKTLIRYDDSQATAIGSFISASVTLGIYSDYQTAFNAARSGSTIYTYTPNTENYGIYQNVVNDTEVVYEALKNGRQ